MIYIYIDMCKYNIGYRVVHKNHGPQTFKAHRTLQSYGIYTWFTNKKLAWVIHLVCKWVCIVRLPAFGLNLIPAESAARSCRVKGKSMEKTMIIELRTKALGFTGPDAENQMVVSLFPSC
jgi:hypothetical protein